tara:strand:+ start:10356 stop:11297 length:942 start_codon:yes stop_codon:yes gene_type:complete
MLTEFKLDIEFILKAGLDISPDCFGILHHDIVVYCNNTFASAFGISKEQAIGKTNRSLLKLAWSSHQGINIETDNFDLWYENNIDKLYEAKTLNQFETDLIDGRWFKMTRMNLENNFTLLFGVNITDLKQTQASLQKANQQIEVLANTDALTATHNRRSFYLLAEQAIKNAKRYYQPLSLLLIDLDHFKKINDNFGHEVGDFVLKEFSYRCQQFIRESDSLSRIGGEEFTILLPQTESAEATIIAEEIRLFINSHSFYIESLDCHVDLSVSIGISALTTKKESIKDLLAQADRALYHSKANGRNQVTNGLPLN